ncbi:HAD family phosphatase [Eubacterium sp. 1001713B170207_170306_E7]|uniref:HAD family hydrolase n=1 Tax=Eubacterium sp. 1001713B170207_170306_E7 TaxID=2787097 RepID=UPI0018986154|nr:HAD family phosphatase [Eubacterium sp. 1001713B170207_170306_E7]
MTDNLPELVIFDMDGLMFDTERLSHEAWTRTGQENGFRYTMEITRKKLGLGKKGVRALFARYFGADAPIERWHHRSHEIKRQLVNEQGTKIIKPGLIGLLKYLDERQVKTAIASSSDREMIDHYLRITGLPHHFDHITSGEEVAKSKPNPEIFLKTCAALDTAPEKALVLEDAYSGFEAARSGGIPVFFVEDLREPDAHIYGEADGVFKNLAEVQHFLENRETAAYN